MSISYTRHFSTRSTPQAEPIPGSKQVCNSAGGYAFAVDDWTRLDRFLILGSEGGRYYATERTLTVQNAEAVRRVMAGDHGAHRNIVVLNAGAALVVAGWTLVGFAAEGLGFWLLFCEVLPTVLGYLRRVPLLARLLDNPALKSVINRAPITGGLPR